MGCPTSTQLFPAQRAFWEWSTACCVCQALLVGTDPNHRLDGQVIRCVKNALDCQNQRAVISSSVPSEQPVMDGVCQGLIIFISYPGNEAEQSLSKFVD